MPPLDVRRAPPVVASGHTITCERWRMTASGQRGTAALCDRLAQAKQGTLVTGALATSICSALTASDRRRRGSQAALLALGIGSARGACHKAGLHMRSLLAVTRWLAAGVSTRPGDQRCSAQTRAFACSGHVLGMAAQGWCATARGDPAGNRTQMTRLEGGCFVH